MYVCMYVYIYIYIYMYTCEHICVNHSCVYILYMCIHIHVYVCIYIYVSVSLSLSVSTLNLNSCPQGTAWNGSRTVLPWACCPGGRLGQEIIKRHGSPGKERSASLQILRGTTKRAYQDIPWMALYSKNCFPTALTSHTPPSPSIKSKFKRQSWHRSRRHQKPN